MKWANAETALPIRLRFWRHLAGEPQLVTYTQSNVVGISATTGKLLWKMANKVPYDVNSVSPVVYKDLVIVSIYEKGVGSDPAVKAGRPTGSPGGLAKCGLRVVYEHPCRWLEIGWLGSPTRRRVSSSAWMRTPGKTLWESSGRMGENAAILNAGDLFLFLTDEAKLFVLKSNATSFAPLKEYEVASSPTWAHPVLLGNRILVKDKTTLAALAF